MARQELRLVKERRLVDLIAPPKGSGVLEASGVIARGADFYVIFDNVRHVARIDRSLSPASKRHGWFGRRRAGDGYEDIAYSAANRRFYLLIEAEKHADGSYKPLIDECDEHGTFKGRHWVDIPFAKRNTGLEGRHGQLEGHRIPARALRRQSLPRRQGRPQGRRRPHPRADPQGIAVDLAGQDQAAEDGRLRGLLRGLDQGR